MESSLKLIATLLNDLRDAGIVEYEFVRPQSASLVKPEEVEAAIQRFAVNLKTSLGEQPQRESHASTFLGAKFDPAYEVMLQMCPQVCP